MKTLDGNTLKKLGYAQVIDKLAEYAGFGVSRELIYGLEPLGQVDIINDRIKETDEAKEVLRLHPMFSFGALQDIREALHRGKIGGMMSLSELTAVGDMCRSARMTRGFFSDLKGNFPLLIGISRGLGTFKTIETALEKAIGSDGAIKDSASERLGQIRRNLKVSQERIKERLDNFVHNSSTAKYLQDPIVTIRAERFVVPVKQEYRNQVPGIVHDTSASGATIFVEPMAVMEANNDLIRLKKEEEEEIQAILKALTMVVNNFGEDLSNTVEILGNLDFIFARAKYSYDIDGVGAKISPVGNMKLLKARHPLLPGNVVPIDVYMKPDLKAMVVTGPNTGGKTVSIKTIGLLTLMALAGLHVPADQGTEIPFFRHVFADIGDEQSIEQSLSTFSAHLVNIIRILGEVTPDSLVLLDELGAGTDPQEGAALAMSILEYFYKKGAKVVATTHYSELKAFAYNRDGFINASVEFDVETLAPTYRLIMGIPGKSNAFEISEKLGLPESIIEKAAMYLTPDDNQVADLISGLEQDRLKAKTDREAAESLRLQVEAKAQELEEKQVALANKEVDLLQKAHAEAAEIVRKAREESDALYKELQQQVKAGMANGKQIHQTREKIKRLEDNLRDKVPDKEYMGVVPDKIELGQLVEIPKLNQKGYILQLPNENGDVQVQAGILKIMVKLSDLRTSKATKEQDGTVKIGGIGQRKAKTIASEIDIRGTLPEEAMELVDKYLDDAFISRMKTVRIIHGKGTGVLRKTIQEYLKDHRLVKSYKSGDYHSGGLGVTEVELDL